MQTAAVKQRNSASRQVHVCAVTPLVEVRIKGLHRPVCVCVCVRVYARAHTHTRTHAHTHARTHTHRHRHRHTHTHTHTHTHSPALVEVWIKGHHSSTDLSLEVPSKPPRAYSRCPRSTRARLLRACLAHIPKTQSPRRCTVQSHYMEDFHFFAALVAVCSIGTRRRGCSLGALRSAGACRRCCRQPRRGSH